MTVYFTHNHREFALCGLNNCECAWKHLINSVLLKTKANQSFIKTIKIASRAASHFIMRVTMYQNNCFLKSEKLPFLTLVLKEKKMIIFKNCNKRESDKNQLKSMERDRKGARSSQQTTEE
ncbi:CLUMA_CG010716, isoform A [Clunio marinus]|uniref:CLUMA_CG010716, isoform A n=1 Tax=Clunio marinus TaxID=568069 RepID=A0A1J1IC44_9DIPT|nr:CLUMA_CG010716, isoform A [Clunio marinus]